ncbi:MAG: Maltose permease, type [Bacillales bacterium]|nr:Maltose permease, type [Bacillales bacterium]
MTRKNKLWIYFRGFYGAQFIGFGAFLTLISVYLTNYLKLEPIQVSIILSVNPIVMILAQPIWGILSDLTRNPKRMILITILGTFISLIIYSQVRSFGQIVLIAIVFSFLQTAINPLADHLTVSYTIENNDTFGSVRLWGSIGFAFGSLLMGKIADNFGLNLIFYVYMFLLFISVLIMTKIPNYKVITKSNEPFKEGIKSLISNKKYLVFLMASFLIFGPIYTNNFYFGILIQTVGGTLSAVGVAFLIAAGSEAPFMQKAALYIRKYSIENILIFAALISGLRWTIYIFQPSVNLIYASSILQGVSVGLLIPAALTWVRDNCNKSVQSSAISIYFAISNGLGSWFCTVLSGKIIDLFNISYTYLMFSILTTLGIVTLFYLKSNAQFKVG